MSYCILPKNNNMNINIQPNIDFTDIKPYTSHSLYFFYKEIINQLNCLTQTNDSFILFENLLKTINPYEYIFSRIPGFKSSVSKLKTKTNLFYELLEIINTLNIFESFLIKNIKSIHFSENYVDSNQCINFLRDNQNDENVNFENTTEEIYNKINDKRYDFIFYDIKKIDDVDNINYYILTIIEVLMILLKYQSCNGVCIIKISHIFHKPVIDILYILCSIYEKVYIIKPNASSILSFNKYIVCKNFILNENKKEIYKNYFFKLAQFISIYLQNNKNKNILSIIDYEMPAFFINKIDDINIIIGQQQLESNYQLINVLKNKNKEEKIENFKKSNIQKCAIWCEKFKIPYNIFSEKVNIFLPLKIENEDSKKADNEEI